MSRITARDMHHALIVSPKQAERMKQGRLESHPSDYGTKGSAEDRRQFLARKALEERRELKELEASTADGYR